MLLDKISSKNQIVSDRFYRALYSKLLLPSAMNSSKVSKLICFLRILCFKVLFLNLFANIQSLMSTNLFQEEMFIGLLLRAMKNDLNLKRVSAFAKRLLQVSSKIYT